MYLLTFIVAFASRALVSRTLLQRALPFVVLPLLVTILSEATEPISLLIPVHVLGFTAIALICHCALADDAPEPAALTEFYLWLSIGGALGGVFNAMLAPFWFDGVQEYPLVLAAAALLVGGSATRTSREPDESPDVTTWADAALPLALGAFVIGTSVLIARFQLPSQSASRLLALRGAPSALRPRCTGVGHQQRVHHR
jgi:hypothetical protein